MLSYFLLDIEEKLESVPSIGEKKLDASGIVSLALLVLPSSAAYIWKPTSPREKSTGVVI